MLNAMTTMTTVTNLRTTLMLPGSREGVISRARSHVHLALSRRRDGKQAGLPNLVCGRGTCEQ